MIAIIEDVLGFLTGGLLLVVFFFLLRGPGRRFPFIAVYVAWEFLATSALTIVDRLFNGSAVATASKFTEGQKLYAHLYWTNDILVDLFRFLIVIVLTYRATPEGPRRASVGRLLGGVAVAVMLLPFVLFHPSFTPWPTGQWFNSTVELLNFGAAIMNLVLWGTLIASRQRDPRLLTVSAGLGVVVTGASISYGVRHFIQPGVLRNAVPDLFLMLTQLAGWAIWCWAFRPVTQTRKAPTDALRQV